MAKPGDDNELVRSCGATIFDRWSDRPLRTYDNSKRYPNVKSRYREPAKVTTKGGVIARARLRTADGKNPCESQTAHSRPSDATKAVVEPLTAAKAVVEPLTAAKAVVEPLPAAERAYLDSLEEERPDVAATLGLLLTVDEEMDRPRLRWNAGLLAEVKGALTSAARVWDHASFLRAAFAFRASSVADDVRWAAELCALAALAVAGDGSERAVCAFVAGRFCAEASDFARSVRFYETVRHCATDDRRTPLPDFVATAFGSDRPTMAVGAAARREERRALVAAADRLDPARALLAVRAAAGLTDPSAADDDGDTALEWAAVAYELGKRYAAAGQPERALETLMGCVTAGSQDVRLQLDALLEAAVVMHQIDENSAQVLRILELVVEGALRIRNRRILVSALAAKGRVLAGSGRTGAAYRSFAMAHQLTVATANRSTANRSTAAADVDERLLDTIRMYAAACSACSYLQSRFPGGAMAESRDVFRFDDLRSAPDWSQTDDRSPPLVVWHPGDGRMMLNVDLLQDRIVEAQVRRMALLLDDEREHFVVRLRSRFDADSGND